ncbi:cell division protein FtsL, partial [Teichococcus wenyumeiae]
MFRPLTIIAITAFCVVGWNVYRAEDSARQLDRELRDLTRRIEQARDRTQVLRAEWALLNEPERLRQVAQKYLPLETMTPAQFIRLADLGGRLPVAVAFSGPVNLFGSTGETAVAEAKPITAPTKPATTVAAATPAAEAPEPAAPPVRVAA